MSESLDQSFWDKRYLQQSTGWDLGAPSPPLKEYIDQLTNKDLAILIPGCGNAYEAAYLLKKGFTNITLLDISPVALELAAQKLAAFPKENYTLVREDFFDHHGQYDLVLEQTFFCAIDPALRKYYCDKVYNNLKSTGKLVGLLFDRDFEGGPPFGGRKKEYEDLFASLFDIITMEPAHNSAKPRQGTELFIILRKRLPGAK